MRFEVVFQCWQRHSSSDFPASNWSNEFILSFAKSFFPFLILRVAGKWKFWQIFTPSGHLRQCDQTARIFFIIWLLAKAQICPKFINIYAKVGSKLCQTLNKPSKVCKILLKVCPSGEISPNQVTLQPLLTKLEWNYFVKLDVTWWEIARQELQSTFT